MQRLGSTTLACRSQISISVAWYCEALGLTCCLHGRADGERLELLAVDVQPSAWDDPIEALRAGVPPHSLDNR